jgi:hypothetical protein
MAKTAINVGSSANDGTGDPLRTAMQSTNSNFNELYGLLGDGSTLSISGDVTMSAGAVTIANGAVENAMMAANSIDSDQYVDGSIDTVHIADDNITFAKIENRYTAKVEKSDTSGAVSIDWSAGTTFEFTASLTGALELDFTNFKQGQVIGIYGLTGSQTITLDSDAATSETFNRIGTSEYDGTGSNYLQVACVDDSADAVFNYSVITYTSDTTP